MNSLEGSSPAQEKLIGDLRLVIENAEELLLNTAQYPGAQYQDARARLTQALNAANDELTRFEEAKMRRMMDATRAANLLHQDRDGEARILRAFS
jgi:ElaB/YqjD/DUF883 family membrane-anchored ribosome-binding protein